jgi:hypothetical protein
MANRKEQELAAWRKQEAEANAKLEATFNALGEFDDLTTRARLSAVYGMEEDAAALNAEREAFVWPGEEGTNAEKPQVLNYSEDFEKFLEDDTYEAFEAEQMEAVREGEITQAEYIERIEGYKVDCPRCDGTGKVWAKHVANGVCFKCEGAGYLVRKTDPKKLEAARLRREAKKEAARLEYVARMEAEEARKDALYGVHCEKARAAGRIGDAVAAKCLEDAATCERIKSILNGIDKGEIDLGKSPHLADELAGTKHSFLDDQKEVLTKDGEIVLAKLINGHYGMCWAFCDEDGNFIGEFLNDARGPRSKLSKLGYKVETR